MRPEDFHLREHFPHRVRDQHFQDLGVLHKGAQAHDLLFYERELGFARAWDKIMATAPFVEELGIEADIVMATMAQDLGRGKWIQTIMASNMPSSAVFVEAWRKRCAEDRWSFDRMLMIPGTNRSVVDRATDYQKAVAERFMVWLGSAGLPWLVTTMLDQGMIDPGYAETLLSR